jgi:membrane-associated protease RseP (regulator of RpoE activity)
VSDREPRRLPALPRWLPAALLAGVLCGAAVYGLIALIGSGAPKATAGPALAQSPPAQRSRPPGAPKTPSPAQTTAATLAPSSVRWLGMEILTLSSNLAVIDTVANGSEAAAAGLEPGDQIVSVNHHAITAATQIPAAIAGRPRGSEVEIDVNRGSTAVRTLVRLGAAPTVSP